MGSLCAGGVHARRCTVMVTTLASFARYYLPAAHQPFALLRELCAETRASLYLDEAAHFLEGS